MIVSKTPLRISFFCGGTDIAAFYRRSHGAALSATIDKYIWVCAYDNDTHDTKFIWNDIEVVDDVSQMQHAIVRETLLEMDVFHKKSIVSMADISHSGAGLGSSSAFTVGLIGALRGPRVVDIDNSSYFEDRTELAELACKVEIERCGFCIGKQDQYAAAMGGFNLFVFGETGKVQMYRQHDIHHTYVQDLQDNLLLVYSGRSRSSDQVLAKQVAEMQLNERKFDAMCESRDRAWRAAGLITRGETYKFGEMLEEQWLSKCETGMDADLLEIHDAAMSASAVGGKLCGAGGGGFFVFFVRPEHRKLVIDAITEAAPLAQAYDFKFTSRGSEVFVL